MNRRQSGRLGATIGIAGIAALTIPSVAQAHDLAATCDALQATSYPAGHHLVTVGVTINGQPAGAASYPWDGSTPPALPVPYSVQPYQGDLVEISAGSTSSDGFVVAPHLLLSGRLCGPVRAPEVVVQTPGGQPQRPALEPLPLVQHPGKTTKPQKPHPRRRVVPIKCSTRWRVKPKDRGATYRGADNWWHPFFAKGGAVNCGHEPAVAGELPRAQGPAPGTIVSRLLNVVPLLAEDLPGPASSISQSAGGRSATDTMDATERGRLVPKVIPGHPWTTKSTSPHRGVVASVSWKSGRLTVSVLYSASRGKSTTSVSAR